MRLGRAAFNRSGEGMEPVFQGRVTGGSQAVRISRRGERARVRGEHWPATHVVLTLDEQLSRARFYFIDQPQVDRVAIRRSRSRICEDERLDIDGR